MEVKDGLELTSSLEELPGPWLVLFCKSQEGRDHQQVFYSLGQQKYCIKSIFETRDSISIATPQGWILTMNPNDNVSYLQDPTSTKIKLPRPMWDLTDCDCILSSSPTNPKCKVLVANMNDRKLFFCQPSDKQWTEYKYDLGSSNPITSITVLDDKFYGVTLRKNLVTIDCPPNPGISILESIITEHPFGVDSYQTFIAQSCGELFLLEQLFDHSNKTVHISVMKKDFSKQEWVKVESIGHRVFLLGDNNCSAISFLSNELSGLKENCIYFVQDNCRWIYCFDIEEGFISVHLPCLKSDPCNKVRPIWMISALENKDEAFL